MGGTNVKTTKQDLIQDITKLNLITNSELFKKRTEIQLEFILELEPDFFSQVLGQFNDIKVIIERINIEKFQLTDDKLLLNQVLNNFFTDSNLKTKYLSRDEFYRFYNTVLDCLPVFYENSIQKIKSTSESTQQEIAKQEQELCCICEENKSDVMLECYHLFCEDCISTWLFKKVNSCPLCRVKVSLNDVNDKKTDDRNYWSVIEKEQVDNNEYMDDMRARLCSIIREILL